MNNVANDVRQSIVNVIANIQQKVVGYQATRSSDRRYRAIGLYTAEWSSRVIGYERPLTSRLLLLLLLLQPPVKRAFNRRMVDVYEK